MSHLTTMLNMLLRTVKKTHEANLKKSDRGDFFTKANFALSELKKSLSADRKNLAEIKFNAGLLLFCLSNILFLQLEDETEFQKEFKYRILKNFSLEDFVLNYLYEYEEKSEKRTYDRKEELLVLIDENFMLIDSFIKEGTDLTLSDDYVGGELSIEQVVCYAMSDVFEILMLAIYEDIMANKEIIEKQRQMVFAVIDDIVNMLLPMLPDLIVLEENYEEETIKKKVLFKRMDSERIVILDSGDNTF